MYFDFLASSPVVIISQVRLRKIKIGLGINLNEQTKQSFFSLHNLFYEKSMRISLKEPVWCPFHEVPRIWIKH